MNREQRDRVRIADRVHEQIVRLRRRQMDELQFAAADGLQMLTRWQQLAHRMDLAKRRGFEAASMRLADQLRRHAAEMACQVQAMVRRLAAVRLPEPPEPRHVLDELAQIEDEFGEYVHDSRSSTLSVITDPIHLEGVPLGRFRIALRLDRLAEERAPYDVIALDPHPAAGSDHVTHPHVSDDRLCEGDAAPAIRAALEAGRLGDFFLLVSSVLTTYNPSSPYVALDEWSGDPCADCGHRMHGDDRLFCADCEQDYCNECIGACRRCDETRCLGCLKTCSGCREEVCDHCRHPCTGCANFACGDCVADELCPTCLEAIQEEDHEQDHEEPTVHEGRAEEQPAPQAAPPS